MRFLIFNNDDSLLKFCFSLFKVLRRNGSMRAQFCQESNRLLAADIVFDTGIIMMQRDAISGNEESMKRGIDELSCSVHFVGVSHT